MCYGPVKWSRHIGCAPYRPADEHTRHARYILGSTEHGTCTDVAIQISGARADLLSKAIRKFLTENFSELEIR